MAHNPGHIFQPSWHTAHSSLLLLDTPLYRTPRPLSSSSCLSKISWLPFKTSWRPWPLALPKHNKSDPLSRKEFLEHIGPTTSVCYSIFSTDSSTLTHLPPVLARLLRSLHCPPLSPLVHIIPPHCFVSLDYSTLAFNIFSISTCSSSATVSCPRISHFILNVWPKKLFNVTFFPLFL